MLHIYNRIEHTSHKKREKSIWWMPWRKMPKKDVEVCDKPRGADKQALLPVDVRMGKPDRV